MLENVKKSFSRANGRRHVVFDGLNITIRPGDSIAVMGAKLSGKTTFIRLLTGFERPDEGKVRRFCEISYPVGYSGVLSSNMTGRENIAFVSRVYNCNPRIITDFVAHHSELGVTLDRLVAFYTQDDKSRLAFMLSYAIPFGIYVLDGNVGRGSEDFREKCASMLDIRAQTSGIVLATANPQLAKRHCNKVLIVERGTAKLYDDVDFGIMQFKAAKARASA